jgi:hypothetical protein
MRRRAFCGFPRHLPRRGSDISLRRASCLFLQQLETLVDPTRDV